MTKTYTVLKPGITQRKSTDKESPDWHVMVERAVGEQIEVTDLAAPSLIEAGLIERSGQTSRLSDARRIKPREEPRSGEESE